MAPSIRTTRLAPSPTGDLHFGNLRTFLLTWLQARTHGWRLLLRIEDLDGPRVTPHAVESTITILRWLGLEWDGPIMQQSADLEPYRAAMSTLAAAKLTYSCHLSRAEIRRALSAPHADDRELRVPAAVRPSAAERYTFARQAISGAISDAINHRFTTPDERVDFVDRIAGAQSFVPAEEVGDFIIWTKGGVPSYQLAVCVDDQRQGVTDVIRGDDLLSSAARQTLLHRALGHAPPHWWHVPLVLDEAGERLAKRRDSRSALSCREAGVPVERVLGLLGSWIVPTLPRAPRSLEELRAHFAPLAEPDTLARLQLRPVRFTEEAFQWLLT